MTRVGIYHNVSPDAGFGLNRVFDNELTGETVMGRVRHTPRSHELVKVFEYDQADVELETQALLNDIYRLFNIGHEPHFGTPSELAVAYRARRLRSLRKGDVVQLGDDLWSCESAGWSKVPTSDLSIVGDPADAERLVRQRFDFGPVEELSITVPWEG